MSAAEEYNFQAPQFVESLANVEEVEDGADNFFDAEEENAISNKKMETEGLNVNSQSASNENAADDKINKEVEPESFKKVGRHSKVTRMSMKSQNSPLRRSPRFTSLAEQIHKFHHATPPRFKRKSGAYKSRSSKFLPTIAQSPLLQTKTRSRPSVIPPVEERPVFKPIKRPPSQPKPPPKPAPRPTTVPQPFNLTDPSKFKKVPKAGTSEEESSSLKKNTVPVPKTSVKTPQKPVNIKKKNLAIEGDKIIVKENWAISGLKTLEKTNTRTKVVPFSFEQRNQERLKAKQQKLGEAKENKPDNFKVPSKPIIKGRSSVASNEIDGRKTRLARPSLNPQK